MFLRDTLLCILTLHVSPIFLYEKFSLDRSPLGPLEIVHDWSAAEYDYQSMEEQQREQDGGTFINGTTVWVDVHAYYPRGGGKRKTFITMPRIFDGSPVTLATVSDIDLFLNPYIIPYPSWSWHRNSRKCYPERIVSAWAVRVDNCERLWVLDSGKIEDEQVCPPQLLIFDPKTDKLIHRYEIPSDQLESTSLLTNFDLDDFLGCREIFAYITDAKGFALIIYDHAREVSYKASHKTSMYPHPDYGTFDIGGEPFEWMYGINAIAVTPHIAGYYHKVVYHPAASAGVHWAYTDEMRNQSNWLKSPEQSPEIFHTLQVVRHDQSPAIAITDNHVMFYTYAKKGVLGCYKANVHYLPENVDIITEPSERLHFVTGMKVIKNFDGEEELWILGTRPNAVFTKKADWMVWNVWIQKALVKDLIKDSEICKQHGDDYNAIAKTPRDH